MRIDAALLCECINNATMASANKSFTGLASHSMVAIPIVLPIMTRTSFSERPKVVTNPPYSLKNSAPVVSTLYRFRSSTPSSTVLSLTLANISFRNSLTVEILSGDRGNRVDTKGTWSLEETEPTRSWVYVDKSWGETILDWKLWVTSIPFTGFPSAGVTACRVGSAPSSSSFTGCVGRDASIPITLAFLRLGKLNFTGRKFSGMVIVGRLLSANTSYFFVKAPFKRPISSFWPCTKMTCRGFTCEMKFRFWM
mmetsp:Transcript_45903/g.55238  ORF Transcript_45903/g.55238 Transcript_45903/m.55238 type:complete len:253 (-) Transcript_45903:1092-1850(-)